MAMNVTPVDATLGAIVTDVDLANLNDETWSQIHHAFLEYGVLVFPAQHLDEDAQAAFARPFGQTEKLSPRQNGANVPISTRKPDGRVPVPDSAWQRRVAHRQHVYAPGFQGRHAERHRAPT